MAYIVNTRIKECKRDGKSLWVLMPAFIQQQFKQHNKKSVDIEKKEVVVVDIVTPMLSAPVFIDTLQSGYQRGLNSQLLTLNFKFDQLSLTLPDNTEILSGVSGIIRGGRMLAIMGPSGAGSTSFI